jgi:hypothetical protein
MLYWVVYFSVGAETVNRFVLPFAQVSLLSRIHHRNLEQFLGFCQEVGKSMLVYEFMHNGTLKEHLYGNFKCF